MGKPVKPPRGPPPPPPPPPPRHMSNVSKWVPPSSMSDSSSSLGVKREPTPSLVPTSGSKRPKQDIAPPPAPTDKSLVRDRQVKCKSTPSLVGSNGVSKRSSDRLVLAGIRALRDVEVYSKIAQVGQGTYGSVFMGKEKISQDVVALKRINTEQEENGFPITALREVKILKALNNPHVVKLKEIVTSKEKGNEGSKSTPIPKNVFMVFEYLEYDLTGLLETAEIRLSQDHIKSWTFQLLKGVAYMHTQQIIHRDLKASNLLISKNGVLKIADWGLARSWTSRMKRLTNRVITLWYRPPELLLGCVRYTPKIDMWSVGCIVAEMFRRVGFLKGSTEQHQLDLIFQTAGMPDLESWPNVHEMCPLWKNYEPERAQKPRYPRRLKDALTKQLPNRSWMTDSAFKLIDSLLILNPEKRASAREAAIAEYFFEHPMKKEAHELNMNFPVSSVHEWEARMKHQEKKKQNTRVNPQAGRPDPPRSRKASPARDPRPAPPSKNRPAPPPPPPK